MRALVYGVTILLIFILSGCDKSNIPPEINSIVNTEWILLKIIDNNTGKITSFPDEIDKFHISFKQYGIIELPNYCNYSYGTYELPGSDKIIISRVGPGTEKYCSPNILMNWETLFINALRESKTYSYNNSQLTIESTGDYDLIFEFVQSYTNTIGQLLICTNSAMINCPFEIRISVNNTIIDTLTAASTYLDTACQCDDDFAIGIKKELPVGEYIFYAEEINCQGTNRVNDWLEQFEIRTDSCTKINLDIFE